MRPRYCAAPQRGPPHPRSKPSKSTSTRRKAMVAGCRQKRHMGAAAPGDTPAPRRAAKDGGGVARRLCPGGEACPSPRCRRP